MREHLFAEKSEDLRRSAKTVKARSFSELPLSAILITFFVLQICLAVGLTGYLSFRNGQKAVSDLARQLRWEVSARIQQRLDNYMTVPLILAKNNQDAINLGALKIEDTEILGKVFWKQVKTSDVSYVLFGRTSGQHLAAGYHFDDDRITIDEVNPQRYGSHHLFIYETDEEGNRSQIRHDKGNMFVNGTFPIQKEGWYAEAIRKQRPVWTPVYNWEVTPFPLSIATSRPVYDQNNQLIGVVAVEQQLSQMSDFFQKLRISPSGKAFVVERNGFLIASSSDEKPFKVQDGKPVRLLSEESQDPLIQSTSHYLRENFGSFQQIKTAQQLTFELEGERQYVQVLPWSDPLGLEWLVVIAVPESDFMSQISNNTRVTILLCLGALALAIAIGIYASRWIVKPAFNLSQASYAIASGNLDQTVQVKGIREFSILSRAFNRMTERLQASFADLEQANEELEQRVAARTETLAKTNQALEKEIGERQQIEEQLRYGTLHDTLTHCPNRAFLMERLALALKRAKRSENYLFAVLFIDLDRFKVINDSLGHQVGDQLLIAIARQLEILVRETDIIARLGGDEFVILLDPIANLNEALKVAKRIVTTLNSPFRLESCQVSSTASIGIALNSSHYQSGAELLRDADIAMYRAKANGKAQYAVFNPDMYTQAFARLQLENDLRQALRQQEFQLHYHPIYSLRTQTVVGCEVLLRWLHPQQGWIAPAEFIPIAEETGLIVPISEWILKTACSQLRQWHAQVPGTQSWCISINLSLKQISQPDFLSQLDEILRQTGLSGQSVRLELTESMLMENVEERIQLLSRLKDRKIRLSIDDFGTGYSSLNYLHRLPIDTLKIDQSFVRLIGTDHEGQSIVETIINLAQQLGMDVIAEGVETLSQLEQLQALNCQEAQGHLFSEPLPPDTILSACQDGVLQSF